MGSRLMSLLEKVRLVKKKEKKPEEEPPAEEAKPREDWALGRDRVGAGSPVSGEPLGKRQAMRNRGKEW